LSSPSNTASTSTPPHDHQQGEQAEEEELTNVRLKIGDSSLKKLQTAKYHRKRLAIHSLQNERKLILLLCIHNMITLSLSFQI
jgi:hypothetical protein